MANNDRARKLLVRSALVTSTTVATFVGAQNLAMLDVSRFAPTEPAEVVNNLPATSVASLDGTVASTLQTGAPELTIRQAAPSVIVIRRAGQAGSGANAIVLQPPSPSQLPAPDPIIVQQSGAPGVISAPAPFVVQRSLPQRSGSSR